MPIKLGSEATRSTVRGDGVVTCACISIAGATVMRRRKMSAVRMVPGTGERTIVASSCMPVAASRSAIIVARCGHFAVTSETITCRS